MFKTYWSGHVYGFGRFVGIVAESKQEKGVTAEIYLFGEEIERPIFEGLIEHIPTEIIQQSKDFVKNEALMHLNSLVTKYQYEAYKRNNDKDIIKNNPAIFQEGDKVALISLKNTPAHSDTLKDIAKDTLSTPLREYINLIYSWEITIERYKRKG